MEHCFDLAVLVWAFGWSSGKRLVGDSYRAAKLKALERSAAQAAG